MIRRASRPLVMLGAAASRPRLGVALSDFLARTQLSFFTTQMGKGLVAGQPTENRSSALMRSEHVGPVRHVYLLRVGYGVARPLVMGSGGAAVPAYLGRCRGATRFHTDFDLRVLRW
jgi:acetolactate synthase I/II/III large subunit